jgi:hypothetical protein
MSKRVSPHDSPDSRAELERLQDLRRVLQVTCRMIADDVSSALAHGYHAGDVARALGVDPETVDVLLDELADVLRRWAT